MLTIESWRPFHLPSNNVVESAVVGGGIVTTVSFTTVESCGGVTGGKVPAGVGELALLQAAMIKHTRQIRHTLFISRSKYSGVAKINISIYTYIYRLTQKV